MTYTVALDMLKLININTNSLNNHSSKHYWKKIVNHYSQDPKVHYICIQCGFYLGQTLDTSATCGKCHSKINTESNEGFFLQLSLKKQLIEIFETTNAHNLYSKNRAKICQYFIEDI